jgi:hypothetical protein
MCVLLANKTGLYLTFGGLLIHFADNARFTSDNCILSIH